MNDINVRIWCVTWKIQSTAQAKSLDIDPNIYWPFNSSNILLDWYQYELIFWLFMLFLNSQAYGWAYIDNRHNTWEQFYVYWIPSFTGAILAAWIFRYIFLQPSAKAKKA